MRASPSRAERLLTLVGLGGLVAVVAVWAFVPEPPPTKGGAPEPSLATILALGAGAFLVVGTVRSVLAGLRTLSWAQTQGVVAEARRYDRLWLYLLCRFSVEGAERTVEDVRYALGAPPREGQPVRVRYDPADPSHAAVRPAVSPAAVTALVLGALAMGLSAFSLAS